MRSDERAVSRFRAANCIEATMYGMNFTPSKLPTPVDHTPGSKEKIAELSRRILAGEELFHPLDRRDYERDYGNSGSSDGEGHGGDLQGGEAGHGGSDFDD